MILASFLSKHHDNRKKMENFCQNCEKNITRSDIQLVEKSLNYTFPEAFVSHYLTYNGGVPSRAWWESKDDYAPSEIAFLKPFRYNKLTNNAPKSLIDGSYWEMRRKNVIPENLLPFACDWGGNFFCLDKNDDRVVFYMTDSFDLEISMEKNHQLMQRKLALSFKEFMDNLVTEEEMEEL